MNKSPSQPMTMSVVIPAYNVQDYIGRAIDCVLAQTHPADEIIVVNDGSADQTGPIVQQYGNAVRYLCQENSGASVARNRGVQAAQSEWIAFLDADDQWLPEKMACQVEHLKRNPELVWSYSNYKICPFESDQQETAFQETRSDALLKENEYFEDYLAACAHVGHMLTSSAIIRRDILLEAGLFRVGQLWAQDTDLFLRIAYRWPKIGYLSKPLVLYHSEIPTSITEKNRGQVKPRCDLIERHLGLAAQYNRQEAFDPCARQMLKTCIRRALAANPCADLRDIPKTLEYLLPARFRTEVQIRKKWPRTGSRLLNLYLKIKNALRSFISKKDAP